MSLAIIVDDREQYSPVVSALAAYEDVELSVQRLTAGDYWVNEQLLFERKTLPDLMQSIIDGRLFRRFGWPPLILGRFLFWKEPTMIRKARPFPGKRCREL